jgi:hypothetical protein
MKRRLVLMFALSAVLVGSGAIVNFLLNPYGVWRSQLIDAVFRKPKDEHVALPYLIRSARTHTLLVGSSRVALGMRIDEIAGDDVLNGGVRAATIPQSCAIIRAALDNRHFTRVIWGVDFFAFNARWNNDDREFERRLAGGPGSWIEDTLLSLAALDDGWADIKRDIRGRGKLPVTATRAVPWPDQTICDDFAATRNLGLVATPPQEIERQLSDDVPGYLGYHLAPGFLELFRRTVEQARHRGVQIIVFVPPMSDYELELIWQSGEWPVFQAWKRLLAASGPLWDFSGFNRMAASDQFFMHVMHYKTAVGETILRLLLNEPLPACDGLSRIVADAAIHISRSNAVQVLAAEDQAWRSGRSNGSRFAELAAAALDRQRDHARELENPK